MEHHSPVVTRNNTMLGPPIGLHEHESKARVDAKVSEHRRVR